MKRIWLVSIIFFAVIAICVIEMISVNSTISKIQKTVDAATNSVLQTDLKNASKFTKDAKDMWAHEHEKMAIFIPHVELQDIDETFACMYATLECEETSDFLAASYKVSTQLDQIKDDEIPTISNIL